MTSRLLLVSLALFVVAGCPATTKPIPTPKPRFAIGLKAQQVVSSAMLALPKSTHTLVVVDAMAAQSELFTSPRGLTARRKAGAGHYTRDWASLLTTRFGVDTSKVSHVMVAWFAGQRQLIYVKGPLNISTVPIRNTLIRGKSVFVHQYKQQTWYMAQADGGYAIFLSRADLDAWLTRKAQDETSASWIRLSKHPQSPVHFAIAKQSPLYKMAFGNRADNLRATSIHGWVDARDIRIVVDAEQGTRAAWRVMAEFLQRKSQSMAADMRKQAKKLTTPRALSDVTAAHLVERAGEMAQLKESGEQLLVTVPNVIVQDQVLLFGALLYMARDTMENAKYDAITQLAQLQITRLQSMLTQSIKQNNCAFPKPTVVTPPLDNACACKQKRNTCTTNPAMWKQTGWQSIKFSPKRLGPFAYQLQADGDRMQIVLRSDADCDAVYTTYRASIQAKKLTDGTCVVRPGTMYSRNVRD